MSKQTLSKSLGQNFGPIFPLDIGFFWPIEGMIGDVTGALMLTSLEIFERYLRFIEDFEKRETRFCKIF